MQERLREMVREKKRRDKEAHQTTTASSEDRAPEKAPRKSPTWAYIGLGILVLGGLGYGAGWAKWYIENSGEIRAESVGRVLTVRAEGRKAVLSMLLDDTPIDRPGAQANPERAQWYVEVEAPADLANTYRGLAQKGDVWVWATFRYGPFEEAKVYAIEIGSPSDLQAKLAGTGWWKSRPNEPATMLSTLRHRRATTVRVGGR